MKNWALFLMIILTAPQVNAQTPKTWDAADILHGMKKLEVFGAALYIAAHPDDENTRLLAYLANEKMLRTGYLSLTRGDGGQNLIGNEQGIDLGLVRTQELLAARRIDGAEQFFTRAYDFGFSKSPTEALAKWGHDKILSDVVWVIRKFKPDVIITRFPTTGEGGHGHHTASAILAGEAFTAAADTTMFPDQFKYGVATWQAKRLLWNTFNFGGTNTQREDQLKIDVGMYNPLLGKSYGELAAESRSEHKSQGFGVPAQRGESFEYFSTIKGTAPQASLLEDIDISSRRIGFTAEESKRYDALVKQLISNFKPAMPQASLPTLQQLYQMAATKNSYQKKNLLNLIAACSGLFMEATVAQQLNVPGDSMRFSVNFINRLSVPVEKAQVSAFSKNIQFSNFSANSNSSVTSTVFLPADIPISQPYWLEFPLKGESFDVRNQEEIGWPQNPPPIATFDVQINGQPYQFERPIQYKYTDPVKGEVYQPASFVQPVFVNVSPALIILPHHKKDITRRIQFTLQSNENISGAMRFSARYPGKNVPVFDSIGLLRKGEKRLIDFTIRSQDFALNSKTTVGGDFAADQLAEHQYFSLEKISYDHIPDIYRGYYDVSTVLKMDLQIAGTRIGYINGAGDKVPQALTQMGYEVSLLGEKDITASNLKKFDAIVTGVRAYNTNEWLPAVKEVLMNYISEGGVMLVQYNTNNNISSIKQGIGPYPFTVTRNRVTDENATVKFLQPNHPLLSYPNKITIDDFSGWIQERSIYHAQTNDPHYVKLFAMHDEAEADDDGSLIVAKYGKGRFIYTGLVFFRELPAAVPGAFRIMANLLAPSQNK